MSEEGRSSTIIIGEVNEPHTTPENKEKDYNDKQLNRIFSAKTMEELD